MVETHHGLSHTIIPWYFWLFIFLFSNLFRIANEYILIAFREFRNILSYWGRVQRDNINISNEWCLMVRLYTMSKYFYGRIHFPLKYYPNYGSRFHFIISTTFSFMKLITEDPYVLDYFENNWNSSVRFTCMSRESAELYGLGCMSLNLNCSS